MRTMNAAISVYNAQEAIETYEYVFDAKVQGEIVYMSTIPGYEDKKYEKSIAHSELLFGNRIVYVNDILDEFPQKIGNTVQFCTYYENLDELKKVLKRLRPFGEVKREIEEEHWGAMSATVVDKFGITWNLYFLMGGKHE